VTRQGAPRPSPPAKEIAPSTAPIDPATAGLQAIDQPDPSARDTKL
jgi:hypothetical protein